MKIVKYISITIISLFCISFFVVGCFKFFTKYNNYSNITYNNSSKPKDEITYETECVDAIVTDVECEYWYASGVHWHWYISVEYNGKTYTQEDYNMPPEKVKNAKVGDTISVILGHKYSNGQEIYSDINIQ